MRVRYGEVAASVRDHVAEVGRLDVVSFDVFDTLIHRRCTRAAVHDRVLLELTRMLAERGVRPSANLHAARSLAIQQLCAEASDRGRDPEFHIDDVYQLVLERSVGCLLSGDERTELAARLVRYEVECERRAVLPIVGMRAQLDEIRDMTDRLIFVTDMYLGAENVQHLIDACGYDGVFDRGYASADTGTYKSTGRTFELVLEREGADPAKMLHVGDHEVADDRAPRRLGITTCRIVDPALDRFRLGERLDHPAGVAGTSIALHAWTDAVERDTDTFAVRYGRSVLGPVFNGFVHHVLEASIADGVDHLYFLSRDGFAPNCIYDIAARSARYDGRAPSASYLVVSRLPTVRAIMVGGFSIKALMSARNQLVPTERTVVNTLRSLAIPDDVITSVCTDHLVDPEHTFDDAFLQHPKLLSVLNDARMMRAGHDAGRDAHELLVDYLRQEGFFDHERVGLVDIGWGGTIQDQLHDALQHVDGAPRTIGYYFGGNRSLFDRRTPSNRMSAIVSSVHAPSGDMMLGNSATFAAVGLLEEAARAPHGTCTGYVRRGSIVEPILKPDEHRPGELAGEAALLELQSGMVELAADYFEAVDVLNASTAATLALAHHALQRIVYAPTPTEVEFWRALTHTNDIGGLFQIDERFLPPVEPRRRRPRNWREKTRASMWTHGSVRYLLGAPGLLVYDPAWALSYARHVQTDLNRAAFGVPLQQPPLRRRRADRSPTSLEPTSSSALYEASVARLQVRPDRVEASATMSAASDVAGDRGRSSDDVIELFTPLHTAALSATVVVGRFAPARLRGGLRIVNDGLPIGMMARRTIASTVAPLIVRSDLLRGRSGRLVGQVLARALRC